jgi:hypothetical protein
VRRMKLSSLFIYAQCNTLTRDRGRETAREREGRERERYIDREEHGQESLDSRGALPSRDRGREREDRGRSRERDRESSRRRSRSRERRR